MRNESFVTRYLNELDPSEGVALDIGANKGVYSGILCNKFEAVYAFEPHPKNVEDIKNGVKSDRLFVENRVIGTHDGKAKLYVSSNPGGHSIMEELTVHSRWSHKADNYLEVGSVTLDTFCEGKDVRFIKCDIEGGEKNIFYHGKKTLAQNDITIILETHQVDCDWFALATFFQDYGYEIRNTNMSLVNTFEVDSHYLIRKLPK